MPSLIEPQSLANERFEGAAFRLLIRGEADPHKPTVVEPEHMQHECDGQTQQHHRDECLMLLRDVLEDYPPVSLDLPAIRCCKGGGP